MATDEALLTNELVVQNLLSFFILNLPFRRLGKELLFS